ncbi:PREDICTED: estradiol 17-beta-dehydrogenase 1 isoform X1 [Cercocebus atys]|uniref:estradiol 17-beta-dehydrogenase 1 isoform X1 n=1 Tax=Cercocebus atys TaxID=9531 RepID=UPI0005F4E918|nr:PREDICTED: estradiol 17-beta-dehydrogenase 1 isoform X1 [Cercocebus atys]
MARTVVLITGCSSGIGLHLAVRLASDPSQSFKVYATLRDLKTQGRLWEAARARGCPLGSLETLQLDVRDSKSVAAARERVTEGRVDVLVCNAGLGLLGPLEAVGEDAVASVLDVNVVGTVRVLQAFLPDMKRRGSGRVLVTGSVGGLMGLPFNDVYCASKFALEGLCESLAVLLLPFGVHLSLIECGPVHTAFMEKVLGSPDEVLDRTDIHTFHRFYQYLAHSKQVFREEAQNPEEVTEVSAGLDSGSRGGASSSAHWWPERSFRCRRSFSPLYAPRSRPCATSPPSASCPCCGCAWTTPAAPTTWPPCTGTCSATIQQRPRLGPGLGAGPGPVGWGTLSSAILQPPRSKVFLSRCLPRPSLSSGSVWSLGTGRRWWWWRRLWVAN